MKLLYNLAIFSYKSIVSFAALFNNKAKLLTNGQKDTKRRLTQFKLDEAVIWVHAASLGEFEQGRPIIEKIKNDYPNEKIVLTFFSPSGYEVRKNYPLVDYVFYLPMDSAKNAKTFIDTIKPKKAFFIKYEFWHHYLAYLHKLQIPTFGVSVIFREHQPFFKWYGGWFKKLLGFYTKFYLQDNKSLELLKKAGYSNGEVCGDTRFDRVFEIVSNCKEVDLAKKFINNTNLTIVAGSTWMPDEQLLAQYINNNPKVKLIIAPHEVDSAHISKIETLFRGSVFKYTNPPQDVENYQVMIVNTIGLLSSLYQYGKVTYIGGGFGKGIHNTLEAATFGKPVVFGPNYKKFKEANDLITCGSGFSISNYNQLNSQLNSLFNDEALLSNAGKNATDYVNSMRGATSTIVEQTFRGV